MADELEGLRQARLHVDKPWGGFDQFTLNQTCTVKILTVEAGQMLSLQTHEQRDELWVVIEGDPVIQIGTTTTEAQPGEEFVILRRQRHRLIGGRRRSRLLEISVGFFDEEDVLRLEDRYHRV